MHSRRGWLPCLCGAGQWVADTAAALSLCHRWCAVYRVVIVLLLNAQDKMLDQVRRRSGCVSVCGGSRWLVASSCGHSCVPQMCVLCDRFFCWGLPRTCTVPFLFSRRTRHSASPRSFRSCVWARARSVGTASPWCRPLGTFPGSPMAAVRCECALCPYLCQLRCRFR